MKNIPLRSEAPFKSRDVIRTVVSQPSPSQGINADEMRRRCRLLNALDKANNDQLMIEDADHALLSQLISQFQFATAHPALLAIIDDVTNAVQPHPD